MNVNRIRPAFFISLSAMLLLSCMTTKTEQLQPLTCIPEQLFRCEPDEKKCMTIPIIKAVGAIEFIINLEQRTIRSYSDNTIITELDVDSVENENGLVYLSGKGYGYDKTYRTWTSIIDMDKGRFHFTSITTGAGHIIYGRCYDKKEY